MRTVRGWELGLHTLYERGHDRVVIGCCGVGHVEHHLAVPPLAEVAQESVVLDDRQWPVLLQQVDQVLQVGRMGVGPDLDLARVGADAADAARQTLVAFEGRRQQAEGVLDRHVAVFCNNRRSIDTCKPSTVSPTKKIPPPPKKKQKKKAWEESREDRPWTGIVKKKMATQKVSLSANGKETMRDRDKSKQSATSGYWQLYQ